MIIPELILAPFAGRAMTHSDMGRTATTHATAPLVGHDVATLTPAPTPAPAFALAPGESAERSRSPAAPKASLPVVARRKPPYEKKIKPAGCLADATISALAVSVGIMVGRASEGTSFDVSIISDYWYLFAAGIASMQAFFVISGIREDMYQKKLDRVAADPSAIKQLIQQAKSDSQANAKAWRVLCDLATQHRGCFSRELMVSLIDEAFITRDRQGLLLDLLLSVDHQDTESYGVFINRLLDVAPRARDGIMKSLLAQLAVTEPDESAGGGPLHAFLKAPTLQNRWLQAALSSSADVRTSMLACLAGSISQIQKDEIRVGLREIGEPCYLEWLSLSAQAGPVTAEFKDQIVRTVWDDLAVLLHAEHDGNLTEVPTAGINLCRYVRMLCDVAKHNKILLTNYDMMVLLSVTRTLNAFLDRSKPQQPADMGVFPLVAQSTLAELTRTCLSIAREFTIYGELVSIFTIKTAFRCLGSAEMTQNAELSAVMREFIRTAFAVKPEIFSETQTALAIQLRGQEEGSRLWLTS